MTIGENIKRIRKEKGLTQKALGDKCGLADSAIRRYELGGANPKIITLRRIADGLEVSLSDLIGDDYQAISSDPYFLNSVDPHRAVQIVENMYDTWKEAGFSANNPPETEEDRQKIYPIARRRELLKAFDSLNYMGKVESVKRVQELTEIPRYTAPEETAGALPKNGKPRKIEQLNAAHADDYANAPEEIKQLEENIMDDENF